jgi:hypothetical protein
MSNQTMEKLLEHFIHVHHGLKYYYKELNKDIEYEEENYHLKQAGNLLKQRKNDCCGGNSCLQGDCALIASCPIDKDFRQIVSSNNDIIKTFILHYEKIEEELIQIMLKHPDIYPKEANFLKEIISVEKKHHKNATSDVLAL